MITAAGEVRLVRNDASACFSVMTTVLSSEVATLSTDERMLAFG